MKFQQKKTVRLKESKLNFWTLFKKFRSKVIRNYLFGIITTLIWWPIVIIIDNICFLESGKLSGESANYALLLPKFLQKFVTKLSSKEFFFLALTWLAIYSFLDYLLNVYEEELKVKGVNYVEKELLNKFRRLTFEEKANQGKEVGILVEVDAQVMGNWELFGRDIFRAIIHITTFFISIYVGWISFIFLGWMALLAVISYLFYRTIANKEGKYKEERTKHYSLLINEEINKGNLVVSMGLSSHYEKQENYLRRKNEKLKLSFNHFLALGKELPFALMIAFPLLIVSKFVKINLTLFWSMAWWFSRIVTNCLTYGSYSASVQRINEFLNLPEKNDNLEKLKLTKEIKSINFENVNFKYNSSQHWVLQNYNETFSAKKTNRLTGENGRGKSTILYLILGLIEPNSGQIIIIDQQGKNYNLHQDINLKHWREVTVAYCAHDNLVREGSTGQKQLANIEQVLNKKKEAQIFCFDEADNALDQENKEKFFQKLEELSTDNKIIIYVKHEQKEK